MSQQNSRAADAPPQQSAQRSASPSNSFYALSDDEEGEYNTIRNEETGRGVKLLFSKSKVSIPRVYTSHQMSHLEQQRTTADNRRFTSTQHHLQRIISRDMSHFYSNEDTKKSAPLHLLPMIHKRSLPRTYFSLGSLSLHSATLLASTSRSTFVTETRLLNSLTWYLPRRPLRAMSGLLEDMPLRSP